MHGSKNILFMFPLFKKRKVKNFQIFSTLVVMKSAELSKNCNIWPKMLLSFDAGPSEASLFLIWLRLNKKYRNGEGGRGSNGRPPPQPI